MIKSAKFPELKNKEEREKEIKELIKKLTDLELTISYEPIKKLFKFFKIYINEGGNHKINIPFELINRRIKGNLREGKKEDTWINLENEKFN